MVYWFEFFVDLGLLDLMRLVERMVLMNGSVFIDWSEVYFCDIVDMLYSCMIEECISY